jgi:hypothetical protein
MRVAVADEDRSACQLELDLRLPLVPIRHVEQLHDVGAVIAIALKRTADLSANRRVVGGERKQPDETVCRDDTIAQQLGFASACRSGRDPRTQSASRASC